MSASYLRKYATGTGADIYINVPKAGSANHAVSADWTPAAGDVKVSIDGGTAANIATLPTAIAMGNSAIWKFVFSNAELTGKIISVTVSDSATKAVDDTGFSIETYGNASALHPFDLGTASTAQTGDGYAIVNSGTHGNAALKTLIDAVDNFVDTEIADIQARLPAALVGGRIDASVGAMAANTLTASALATDAVTEIQSGLATSAALTTVEGKIDTVDTVADAILADTGTDGVVIAAASRPGIRKNTALAGFEFLMTDSTNHAPSAGLTVTVTRSIDGGAFASGTLSSVTGVGNGIYKVDFGAGDLNGDVITLRATAAASDDLFVTIKTSP